MSNHAYGEVEQQLAAVIIRDARLCVAIANQRLGILVRSTWLVMVGGYIAAEFSHTAALAGAQVTILRHCKRLSQLPP